jgi:glutaminase
MTKYCLLILTMLLVTSCDCKRYTYGYIVDHNSHIAIGSVKVVSYAALDDRKRDERTTYTDSAGWFEAAFSLNSIAKCGSLKLAISKEGYETQRLVDWHPADTIFLKKLQ